MSVSIILPTYNRSLFLSKSIESVLNQSYEDYELIVIDDGSDDNTREMVKGFKDSRIIYFYQSNQGRVFARNVGIRFAKYRMIAFIDSDDVWCKNKLEKQVKVIKAKNLDWCFSAISEISDDGIKTRGGIISNSFFKDVVLGRVSVPMSTIVIKKEFLLKYLIFDIFYSKYKKYGFEQSEHQDLCIKMSLYGNGYAVQESLAFYGVHSENVSNSIHARTALIVAALRVKYKFGKISVGLIISLAVKFILSMIRLSFKKLINLITKV
jgi:glycosyltransferase involved in cell wall biosynthesis